MPPSYDPVWFLKGQPSSWGVQKRKKDLNYNFEWSILRCATVSMIQANARICILRQFQFDLLFTYSIFPECKIASYFHLFSSRAWESSSGPCRWSVWYHQWDNYSCLRWSTGDLLSSWGRPAFMGNSMHRWLWWTWCWCGMSTDGVYVCYSCWFNIFIGVNNCNLRHFLTFSLYSSFYPFPPLSYSLP